MHHDNRTRHWNVSFSEEEYAIAEAARQSSGLSKAEYGRRAMMHARVLSRLGKEDKEQIARISGIHTSINEIVKVLNKLANSGDSDAADSMQKYLYKIRNRFEDYEEVFVGVVNYLRGKTGI